MNTCLPKELQNIIWEYKRSAEMYDVAMEFKKWFRLSDDGERFYNLHGIIAFNYRGDCYGPWYFISNIFQKDGAHAIGIFGQIPKDEMCAYTQNKLLKIDENRKFNWRQAYIDTFKLELNN